MPKRISTGKRLRFDVFKRDQFTCQYCGQQPPTVLLVADHIVPVARGGETTFENLITACEACNQGKAATALDDSTVRPDADLMTLQLLQEVAELRAYQAAQAVRNAVLAEVVADIQDAFAEAAATSWVPGDELIKQMLNRYPVETVSAAAVATGNALRQRRVAGYASGAGSEWVRYLWGCARNIAERGE